MKHTFLLLSLIGITGPGLEFAHSRFLQQLSPLSGCGGQSVLLRSPRTTSRYPELRRTELPVELAPKKEPMED